MSPRLRRLSITQRLLALTAVALIPAAAVIAYYIVALHQERLGEAHEIALRYGELAALEMERIVSGAEGVLTTVSQAQAVREFDSEPCRAYVGKVARALPQLADLRVFDAEGDLRCREPMPAGRQTSADRPYFVEAVEQRRFAVGEYTISRASGEPTLPLALPILEGDQVVGVIVASLDLGWLGARLRERDFLPGGSLTIADRQGVVLAREPLPERFVGTRIPEEFQPLVRSERPGTIEVTSQDGTRRVLGYFPPAFTGNGLYVSTGVSTEAVLAPVYASTYSGIAIAIAGALGAFAIAWIVGQRLFVRPMETLLSTIAAWRKGDTKARTGVPDSGTEISALAAAIDSYMDEISAEREHQALLVHELDHRVKNILATVQAVASQTFTAGKPADDAVQAFAHRLNALAQTHEILMADNWASADLRRTIETAIRPFDNDEKARFRLSGPDLRIRARAALSLSMAVHELCTNAVKYGALRDEKGHVSIKWLIDSGPQGSHFLLVWTEHDGPPVRTPLSRGFGSRMIERALAAELSANVTLDFRAAGVVCTVRCETKLLLGDDAEAVSAQAA